MARINFNERSWAIDVISEINRWANERSLIIKRAGGENTIKSDKQNSLFPDILLFGDEEASSILQGWELKMPDTKIINTEFIKNAKKKAQLLKLNSFLLWNGSKAVLYVLNDNGEFIPEKNWNELSHINSREDLKNSREEWINLLHKILDDLIYFINKNKVRSSRVIDSINGEEITDIILSNSNNLSDKFKEISKIDSSFKDEIYIWWRSIKKEYLSHSEPWKPLANSVLISWINKFIFAHILKNYYAGATKVDDIKDNISVEDAVEKMSFITKKCDFWNIFGSQIGEEHIQGNAWRDLVLFNEFLIETRVDNFNARDSHSLLEGLLKRSKQKMAGQFSTPKELAFLLAELTIKDKTKNVIDPCCGSGTISRASYEIKRFNDIGNKNALSTTWASDKFSFPLQMATLSLTKQDNIGEILRVFKEDASLLGDVDNITLYDPNNGNPIDIDLPKMDYIISNLPFVQQEDIEYLNPKIKDKMNRMIQDFFGADSKLNSRSDLYVYLTFALWNKLKNNGNMGIIISNSWLSTEMGDTYFKYLNKFFDIEYIITSAKGKWFKNADVVTNILILKKLEKEDILNSNLNNSKITFVSLNVDLKEYLIENEDIININNLNELAAIIRSDNIKTEKVRKSSYNNNEITSINKMGLSKNALFGDCKWILDIKDNLTKANEFFEIARGTRRGWNDMFYPTEENSIEEEYIEPVVRSAREIDGYLTSPKSKAFCCTKSIEELEGLGHQGALEWINKFKTQTNTKGVPLPEKLSRSNKKWYTMLPNTLADIVVSVNPGDRLFFSRLKSRSFVDQRLTRFTLKDKSYNNILLSALLNSILGLYYIEALGFGRGLGALDLKSTTMKKNLYMFDPDLLDDEQIENIVHKFSILENRNVEKIKQEITLEDRKNFDLSVLKAYNIESYYSKIKDSLINLYEIRNSVNI